jgi:hypothetical protein
MGSVTAAAAPSTKKTDNHTTDGNVAMFAGKINELIGSLPTRSFFPGVANRQWHHKMLTELKEELACHRAVPLPPWVRPNKDGHLPGGPCCQRERRIYSDPSRYCWEHNRLSFFSELVALYDPSIDSK